MFKSTLKALALAAAVATTPAHALLTETGVACDGHGTGMTSQPGYLDCAGAFDGNNSNQDADVQAQILSDFGLTSLATEIDVTGSNANELTGVINVADMASPFVLALKAGNAFSLYLFAAHTTTIDFDTLGVGFFSGPRNNEHFGQELSHATVYGTVTAVPEPETYALLAAGLAFVGWASRRRQRQQ